MKAPTTRIFQIVETTFADGTTKTRYHSDFTDLEIMHFLKQREKKNQPQ